MKWSTAAAAASGILITYGAIEIHPGLGMIWLGIALGALSYVLTWDEK